MGVLACDRLGCENIMCEYISPKFGYLCEDCLEELKDSEEMCISSFMSRPKGEYTKDTYWPDVLAKEFKSRYED